MLANRRGLLIGLGAVIAAPAIVHAANIMPVRAWKGPVHRGLTWGEYREYLVHQYRDALRFEVAADPADPNRLTLSVRYEEPSALRDLADLSNFSPSQIAKIRHVVREGCRRKGADLLDQISMPGRNRR
jgi:hypothetical protein